MFSLTKLLKFSIDKNDKKFFNCPNMLYLSASHTLLSVNNITKYNIISISFDLKFDWKLYINFSVISLKKTYIHKVSESKLK